MIKLAQIGVGYWGPNLLRNFVENPNCIVKTVVELSAERRKFVRQNYPKIKVLDDMESVFSDKEIDGIVIATPANTHYDLTIKALQNDKHVLVEKPMAFEVNHVKEIKSLSEEKGLVAMVGHTFLYNNAVRYVKNLIDSGDLGKIRYIYSQRLNLGRIRSDSDALWTLAPHDISIIQYWLNGQIPLSLSREGMSYIQKEIDDVVFLSLKYPNEIMAHIHVSWLDPMKVRRITVIGSEKMVVYDDIGKNKIKIYNKGIDPVATLGQNMDFDDSSKIRFTYRTGASKIPNIEWEEPLKIEVEHFIDCLLNGTDCITGPEHAEEVVRILSLAIE